MPELTQEQKQDLKQWEKQLQFLFILIMGWIFVVTPLFSLFLFKEDIYFYINAGIIIILFIIALLVRHRKKCPNCDARIGYWGRVIIVLPLQCHKCGVKFK